MNQNLTVPLDLLRVIITSVTLSGIFLMSCSSSKLLYKDHIDEGVSTDYINDSLQFLVEYSGNYDLFTEAEDFHLVKGRKVLNKLLSTDDLSEIAAVGATDVSHRYKTALIVSATYDFAKSSKMIGNHIKKKLKLDTLSLFHHSRGEKLTSDSDFDLANLQQYDFNRLLYEKRIGNKQWMFVEYHVHKNNFNLRFIWWVDKKKGFKDIGEEYKQSSFQGQADYILSSFRDTLWHSEKDPFSLAGNAFMKNGNYLPPLYGLTESKQFCCLKDWSLRSQYFQAKMTYESFVGNYRGALLSADNAFGIKKTATSAHLFLDFHQQDAKKILKERSKEAQIIMINEAHHVPQHRAFLRDLLPVFYENGYRYLAVEALVYEDSLINIRKIPTQSSGFYTMEPVFGQLIRTALELGFTLLPYEDLEDCEWVAGADPNNCNTQRDLHQAKNIARFLDAHPGAKIVVYAGYDHIQEKSKGTWKHMAQFINELTDINPLTVDQTEMNEKSSTKYENQYYQFVNLQFNITQPSVMMKGDSCWRNPEEKGFYDLQIFHPRSKYIDDIPDWQFSKSVSSKPAIVKYNGTNSMQLLELFLEGDMEEERPIPILNKLLREGKNRLRLYLPPGKYVWYVKDISRSMNDFHYLNVK